MPESMSKLVAFGFENTQMSGLGYTLDGTIMTPIPGGRPINGAHPAYGLRDPSIARYNGYYYMVSTRALRSNYLGTGATVMTLLRSTNLTDWDQLNDIPAGVPGTTRAWAPEIFVDGDDVYIYYSVSTDLTEDASQIKTFEIYCQKAQNAALSSWGNLTRISGLVTPKVIDPHITRIHDDSRGNYVMFYKDETNMLICRAWADAPMGPWKTDRSGNWLGTVSATEGPQLVPLPDGSWRLYYDRYTANKLAYRDSCDLDNWSEEVLMTYSPSLRHPGYLWLSTTEWMALASRPRRVRLYTGYPQQVPHSTAALVNLGYPEGDSQLWNSAHPTRLVAPTSGWYSLESALLWDSNPNGPRSLGFRFSNNGRISWRDSRAGSGAGYGTEHGSADTFYLSANEYVELIALQSSGGHLGVNAVVTFAKL